MPRRRSIFVSKLKTFTFLLARHHFRLPEASALRRSVPRRSVSRSCRPYASLSSRRCGCLSSCSRRGSSSAPRSSTQTLSQPFSSAERIITGRDLSAYLRRFDSRLSNTRLRYIVSAETRQSPMKSMRDTLNPSSCRSNCGSSMNWSSEHPRVKLLHVHLKVGAAENKEILE